MEWEEPKPTPTPTQNFFQYGMSDYLAKQGPDLSCISVSVVQFWQALVRVYISFTSTLM